MVHPQPSPNNSFSAPREDKSPNMADSPIHRIELIRKTLNFLFLIIVVGLGNSQVLAGIALCCFVLVWISGMPWVNVLKNIRAYIGFILVVTLFPVFFSPGTPLPVMQFLPITQEGLSQGLTSGVRVLLMFMLGQIMVGTTHYSTLNGGGDELFNNRVWRWFHLRNMATITLLAIQLIPIIYEEARMWFLARLAAHEEKFQQNLFGKVQAIAILLVPLMVNILKNTDQYSRKLEGLSGEGIMEEE